MNRIYKPTVVFVAGNPLSGKDTAVNWLIHHLGQHNVHAIGASSIDSVRSMLKGVLIGKNEYDRRLLSDVGKLVEGHSCHRTTYVMKCFLDAWKDAVDKMVDQSAEGADLNIYRNRFVMFVQIRERSLLEKLSVTLSTVFGADIRVLWVDRPVTLTVTTNSSDANVREIKSIATNVLSNEGTVADLIFNTQSLAELWVKG